MMRDQRFVRAERRKVMVPVRDLGRMFRLLYNYQALSPVQLRWKLENV